MGANTSTQIKFLKLLLLSKSLLRNYDHNSPSPNERSKIGWLEDEYKMFINPQKSAKTRQSRNLYCVSFHILCLVFTNTLAGQTCRKFCSISKSCIWTLVSHLETLFWIMNYCIHLRSISFIIILKTCTSTAVYHIVVLREMTGRTVFCMLS